jgi:putrescine aminotransferase
VQRAAELGAGILDDLRRILGGTCPDLVREVRGAGLLLGVEFDSVPVAAAFAMELLDRRVLAGLAAGAPRVVRLTPPAVLTDTDLDWLLDSLTEAARAVATRADEGTI